METMKDVYILGGARTPMAEYTGRLKDFSALDLGAIAARAALERTGVRPERSITSCSATFCRPARTRSTARGTSG
jgi:acetyl-CoA acetyltransferase